ncbi:hypothetical protein LZ198_15485 [Myxococcus sp. K15C18031901]|uniref:hypothetical protein n=1 Tax=Myxococcus dinghuensis TaxID=2906761 RepID=UPI0020A75C22|nr:hypothetical protein [Myxococcus dinghuensis]MCP3100272.1 hypothetical protein [Myxococcus dinghuensis]
MSLHRTVVGALVLWATGCGGGAPSPEVAEDVVEGTLLARVELSATHQVEFYEFGPGQVGLRERGTRDEPTALGPERLALPPDALYRALRGDADGVPQALREALERRARGEARGAREPGVEQARADSPGGALPGPLMSRGNWESWESDALWWRDTFCGAAGMDEVFCPTNVGWADTGYRKTTYFETAGLAADFVGSAVFFLDGWNCVGTCSWKRLNTWNLQPRYYQRWILDTTGWFRSRIDVVAPSGRVDLAAKWRRAFPDLQVAGEFPSEVSPGYTDNLQGVTHDAANWYMTNTTTLYKMPVGRNLAQGGYASISSGIPAQLSAYNHLGDLSYHAGRLYVPIEGSTPGVAVFDTNLTYIAHATLPGAADAAWCAVNPVDGKLYTSNFNDSVIRRYKIVWLGSTNPTVPLKVAFEWEASLPIRDINGTPVSLSRLQGGEFSPKGNLYLVSDVVGRGVIGVDVRTGRIQVELPVNFTGGEEELEGITIWDLDSGIAPGISGQIHVQMIDNDFWNQDDFYFKHYRVTDAALKQDL